MPRWFWALLALPAVVVAVVLALVLAGGAFFAFRSASGATVGPVTMASYPGNPPSGVTGTTTIVDCDGTTCPIPWTAGSGMATGITAWNAPAMNPPAYVELTYYTAKNCNVSSQAAVLVTDPLGTVIAADPRLYDSTLKTGLLITPGGTPYVGGTGPILSAGITVIAGDFQCGDNVDSDVSDADGAINDGCGQVAGASETVCDETACADADGKAPWDNCDDDADGAINDGCPQVGGTPEVTVILDPPNNQYLACGNVDGTAVTGWDGLLDQYLKLIPTSTPVNSKVQDAATTFFGVFAGTDGTGADRGSEVDPCRIDRAVGQWLGWIPSRTTVLTEKNFVAAPCDAPGDNFGAPNGQATETNFRDAIKALKPGGGAPDKPVAGDELVVFVSAHGSCGSGAGQLQLNAGGDHDGIITAADLRDLLSGFPRSVTFTVILDICQDGFGEALMGVKDNLNNALGPGHIEVLEASRATESSYGGAPVGGAGGDYTTAIVDCLASKGGKTVADVDFGNNDVMTWSLELHGCAGVLTTLINAYCIQKDKDGKYIADTSPVDGKITADETSKCALDAWLGGKAAVQALVNKAKNGQGIGPKQHPIFKELGNPDKDPAHPDLDGDGRSNVDEISTPTKVTNPFKPDTDKDGLGDKAELDKGCDPVDPDTDNDGVLDSDEPTRPPGVGGAVNLPPGAVAAESAAPVGDSGWSGGMYMALAAALSAAFAALGIGGWYARRRWLR